MPFKSSKQRKMIFAKARSGVPWARKFIKDAGYGDDLPADKKRKAAKAHAKKRKR